MKSVAQKTFLPINKIICGETIDELKKIPADTVDLIFADPPYSLKFENYEKLIKLTTENTLKNSNGLFILEHYKKNDFSQHYNFFEMRSYGDCSFTFFKQKSG